MNDIPAGKDNLGKHQREMGAANKERVNKLKHKWPWISITKIADTLEVHPETAKRHARVLTKEEDAERNQEKGGK